LQPQKIMIFDRQGYKEKFNGHYHVLEVVMEELKKKVNWLENVARYVIVGAVILGIGASFIGVSLKNAYDKVDKLQKTIDNFQAETVDPAIANAIAQINDQAATIVPTKVAEILSPEKIELKEAPANPGWNVLDKERTGPSYFKDQLGFDHLFGFLVPTDKFDNSNIFTLEEGFRPEETLQFPIACGEREDGTQLRTCSVTVRHQDGGVAAESFSKHWNSLNGVIFLAAPSKQD
jgi:hypothetical protein